MSSPASHHEDPGSISDQSIWGISGFRREADENCALLGYNAANSGNFFTDVPGQAIGPIFRCLLLRKTQKRAVLIPYGVYGGPRGAKTGFSPSITSVFSL